MQVKTYQFAQNKFFLWSDGFCITYFVLSDCVFVFGNM